MAATSTGLINVKRFMFYCYSSQGDLSDDVMALAAKCDWQGIVDYAQGTDFDFESSPFTADDAELTFDAYVVMGIPEDLGTDADGAVAILRPFSQQGFMVLSGGGVTTTKQGAILETGDSSVDAGNPAGTEDDWLTVPLVDVASGEITEDPSNWIICETDKGYLAFFEGDKARLVLRPNGKVWAKQYAELKEQLGRTDGNLQANSKSDISEGTDLTPVYGSTNWSIAMTDTGYLAFRDETDGTLVMAANPQGKLWGADQGGYFSADDLSFDWDSLWAQLNLLWDDLLGALGDSWDWLEGAIEDSWSWLEGAVGDAWDWVEDAASDVWGTVTDPDTWDPSNW